VLPMSLHLCVSSTEKLLRWDCMAAALSLGYEQSPVAPLQLHDCGPLTVISSSAEELSPAVAPTGCTGVISMTSVSVRECALGN
jgi:hypothetical protein